MQITTDEKLQGQIIAGLEGRKKGHSFENVIANKINSIEDFSTITNDLEDKTLFKGKAEILLLKKILKTLGWSTFTKVKAYATGRLATAESGSKSVEVDGKSLKSCKSDIIFEAYNGDLKEIVGVSVKQCNNRTPTNAQVFFTTATAFYNLLVSNGIILSDKALIALKQFCGDEGYRPLDMFDKGTLAIRESSPERFFWEETLDEGREELENALTKYQDDITRLLLQKAYSQDPFPPTIIMHKTKNIGEKDKDEIALYDIDEFLELSHKYSPFTCSDYRVKKGSYKEPQHISHKAPRFGVIQMQRGGQKQHPTQLQFNLKAGYFYELEKI